ncbi:hypothetical protein HYFRA_00007723 [Hymenoscyphus fraxineus]|uniref:Survival motor neuron Tudor domain-containing protein n=1 Tax=Hymenoscyphus fraxineus TaxID=746836 RepID=A0A9N9PN88_9HELO|nr:hypothetical protein HYFRA_00007723 [Hymenoscyphus fraxineus]
MEVNSKSHGEIWDDAVLVNSWNDAQQYHSIQAKGENVADVLRTKEEQDKTVRGKEISNNNGEAELPLNKHPSLDQNELPKETLDHRTIEAGTDYQANHENPVISNSTVPKGPALPQHLIGQVHDESLKNLLMSWYYAGYYTGLYEGQQGVIKTAKHEE